MRNVLTQPSCQGTLDCSSPNPRRCNPLRPAQPGCYTRPRSDSAQWCSPRSSLLRTEMGNDTGTDSHPQLGSCNRLQQETATIRGWG